MQRPGRYRLSGRRRLFIGLAALAVVALIGFGLGRALTGDWALSLPESFWSLLGVRIASPEQETGPGADASPPASGPEATGQGGGEGGAGVGERATDTIAEGAVIVRTVDYELCGDEVSTSAPADSGLVGLARDALALELRDWEIRSFAPNRVELERVEVDGWCAEHTARTLRLDNGELVLYAGSLDDPTDLVPIKPTGYKESELDSSEADILRAGRTFPSLEDALQYLEGLMD